jgi:hypothetical protein
VGAVVVDHLLGHHVGACDDGLGRGLVALFPGEDVVVVLAGPVGAGHLAFEVLAQDRRVGGERLERVHDDGEFGVFDLHRLDPVGGGVAVGRDDEGDLLALEEDLAVGEHHLLVARQRRHPVEAEGGEVGGGEHREDARHLERRVLVDRHDAGVGVGAADEIAEEHSGQLDVVDVVALALGEAGVFHALAL